MVTAISVVLALILSAGILPVVRRVLEARRVLDFPGHRSSHVRPTLRGGGIGPLLAILVAVLPVATHDPGVLVVVPIVGALGAVGLVEDLRGIPTAIRAGLQLAVSAGAIALVLGLGRVDIVVAVLGVVAIAAYVNVTNFMDGIDSVSVLHAVVVGATFAAIGYLSGLASLAAVALVIAAAFLGFLPWNVVGRKIFLGDVGSYTLGGAVALTGILLVGQGVTPVAVVAPCAIYLADTGSTLVVRIARGERWFEAHRSHAYQQLAVRMGSHVMASIVVSLASAATGALGVLTLLRPDWELPVAAAILVAAAAYVVAIRVVTRPAAAEVAA